VGRGRLMLETVTQYTQPPRINASGLMPLGRGLRVIEESRLIVKHCFADGKWARSEIAGGTLLGCQRPQACDARRMISTLHARCSPS
jgi:hypothetical protein